jgi:hypothetical protein
MDEENRPSLWIQKHTTLYLAYLIKSFKGAQTWDIPNRFNYTELSHLDRWLGVYGKKLICIKCNGDIRHFVFYRLLSIR